MILVQDEIKLWDENITLESTHLDYDDSYHDGGYQDYDYWDANP